MARDRLGFFGSWLQRRALARWQALADAAPGVPLADLRTMRAEAVALRAPLEDVIRTADGRLLPAADAPARPLGCDWLWRPAAFVAPVPGGLVAPVSGAKFAPGITLFHDGARPELSLRQIRSVGSAPFALQLEIFGFEGGFISLSFALPAAGLADLGRRHMVRAAPRFETEFPAALFCRLNLRHGPNVEQILRSVSVSQGASEIAFDLAYTELNEKRLEAAWLDLIIEAPRMNAVTLRDLVLLRHPRADI